MRKQTVRNRVISLCLVLAMLIAFPGVAWADVNETASTVGDLFVTCPAYDCWMYNPNNVSGKWATTLEGWAVRQYNNRIFPLVVHPSRVPTEWVDSGRNDAGREAMVEENRYRGTYWKTTSEGLLDIDHGSDDPNSEYNLYLDESTATLHLIDAYLKGQDCIILGGNVYDIMGAETGALTIDLKGENKIVAYHESTYTAGIYLLSTVDGKVVTDDLLLTGDGSLEMECGISNTSYGIFLENGDLTIGVPTADIVVHSGAGKINERTAIKANAVTVAEGSSVSITLEDGSEATAFDAQSVVVESGASLSVTLTNGSSLMPKSASTVSAFAAGDPAKGLTLEEGAALEVIVPSGLVDLSEIFTDASDFSNVTFQVDGLLVLPSSIKAEDLTGRVSGSGNVLISADKGNTGTFYDIGEDGTLKESEDSVILEDIMVYTGEKANEVTDGDKFGYTWTMETWYIDGDGNLTKPVDGDDGTTGGDTTGGTTGNSKQGAHIAAYDSETDAGDASTVIAPGSNEGDNPQNPGEVPDPDYDTIDVWTLTILRPNVVGDITIVQDVGIIPCDGYSFNGESVTYENLDEMVKKYYETYDKDVDMNIVASTSSAFCTVYGEVVVSYKFTYGSDDVSDYPTLPNPASYIRVPGNLRFSGENKMNVVYDISYPNGMVTVENTLTAASINTWKLRLLETADLTLWQGAQLTTNNDYSRILSGVNKEYVGEEWEDLKLQEEYEQRIRKEFLARIEDVLTVQDGAKYTYPATGVSPFYIIVNMVKYFDYKNKESEDRRVLIKVFDEESYEELTTPKIIEWEDGEHTLSEEWIELPVVGDYVDEGTNEKVEIIYSEEMNEEQKEATEKALESVITVGNTFYVVFSEEQLKTAFDIPEDMYQEMRGYGDYPLILQCDTDITNRNGIFSLSIQRPPADGEEASPDEGNGGGFSSSNSSSNGWGSPLPMVDPEDGSQTGGDSGADGGAAGSSGFTQPNGCVSDTIGNIPIDGVYQFRLTSTDGKVPVVAVDSSSFRVGGLVQDGNVYYVKVYAVGQEGATCSVFVDGARVASLQAVTVYGGVQSDTTAPFTVEEGGTYQFRLTSDTMPVMAAGSSSFTVEYAGNSGRDWFFKVHAVGKAGDGCGFYVNGAPVPTAVAHIRSKSES